MTSTLLPSTTVVPFTLEANGSTCAMWFAQIGAPKLTRTIEHEQRQRGHRDVVAHEPPPGEEPGILPRHLPGGLAGGERDARRLRLEGELRHAVAASLATSPTTWASSMYHCGLNTNPLTRLDTKLSCFGLNIATHGAWSATSLSACAHIVLAVLTSSDAVAPALSMLAWISLLQNCAMFGLEFEFLWIEPHPSRTCRKSDGAG